MKTLTVASMVLAASFAGAAFNAAHAAACVSPTGTAIDLTSGGTVDVNGGILSTANQASTGTGVIDSFVRISTNDPCAQGYNTGARPLEYDENNSPTFTRDLSLDAVPVVIINGIAYYEFLLDINQLNNSPLLSLESVELWQSNTTSLTGFLPGSGFSGVADDVMAWSMDGAGDVFASLNYSLNSGSGSGDLFLYAPTARFSALTYVYLFSRFGDHETDNDGFEEWAVQLGGEYCGPNDPTFPRCTPVTEVPEPGPLALLGLGLLGLGLARRRAA